MGTALLFARATSFLCLSGAATAHHLHDNVSDVANLARDLFVHIGLSVVYVAIAEEEERRHAFNTLARDGRFRAATLFGRAELINVGDEPPHVGVILKGFENVSSWFAQAGDLAFNSSYHWLVFDDRGLEGWALRLDSEVVRASPAGVETWRLEEVFRPDFRHSSRSRPYGEWSRDRGLLASHDPGPWACNTPLRRVAECACSVLVQTVIFHETPVTHEILSNILAIPKETALRYMNVMSLNTLTIFNHAVQRYNLTVWMTATNVSGELYVPSGATFSGAVGMLQKREAEVVSSGMFQVSGRLTVVRFPVSNWRFRNMCMYIADGSLGSMNALLAPFHWLTWLATVLLALLGLVLNKFLGDVEWSESLLSSVGSLTGHGFSLPGSRSSGRAVLLALEMFSLLTSGYYSSSIVKALLHHPPPTVLNVHDLLASRYRAASHDWWATQRVFVNGTDPILREIYVKKIRPPLGLGFVSAEDTERALRRPLTATIGADNVLYRSSLSLSNSLACRLHDFDVEPPVHVATAIGKHAAVRELLYAGMLVQKERGVTNRELHAWQQRRAHCSEDNAHGTEAIGLLPVVPVFGVMAVGVATSLIVVLLEHARNYCYAETGSLSKRSPACGLTPKI